MSARVVVAGPAQADATESDGRDVEAAEVEEEEDEEEEARGRAKDEATLVWNIAGTQFD